MNRVYRWQDKDGRGPYKPGMSKYWADDDNQANNPPFFEEFGMGIVKQCRPTEAMGCAFRSIEQMQQWFTEAERQRMRLLGYEFGSLVPDRILAESKHQLVFTRAKPFNRQFTRVDSERVAA